MARAVWSQTSEETMECMVDNLTMNAKNWLFQMHDKLPREFTNIVATLEQL